jgi:hypothetical protein
MIYVHLSNARGDGGIAIIADQNFQNDCKGCKEYIVYPEDSDSMA